MVIIFLWSFFYKTTEVINRPVRKSTFDGRRTPALPPEHLKERKKKEEVRNEHESNELNESLKVFGNSARTYLCHKGDLNDGADIKMN